MKSEQTQLAQKETALKQVLTYLLVTLPNPEQCTIIQHLQAEQKHVQQLLSNKVQFPSNQLFTINYVTIDPGNHHQSRDSTATESELKDGPFLGSLNKSLEQLQVQRQAYHGATFVGNHVHKLLQVIFRTGIITDSSKSF